MSKTGTEQVQHEALNGIQSKTLGDTFARTGRDLVPIAAKFVITEGYPNTQAREAQLDAALAAQAAEAEKDGRAAPAQRFDALGRPITRGGSTPPNPGPEDVPEPREVEETGEQDEAKD